MVEGNNATPT